MRARIHLLDVFHGKKSMLVALGVSVILFLLVELLIFAIFAASSGDHSRIEVRDKTGRKIYDVAGATLSHINFSYFERKYGDIANYDVEVKTVHTPFPVRAWVSASVGVPIVLILLASYLVKVYLTLLQGSESGDPSNMPILYSKGHPFISLSLFFTSSSIFLLGTFIAFIALLFWMVPNFLGEIFAVGTAALREGGRVFQGVAVFFAALLVWIVYLRYRLSKRLMDYQFRLEQQKLEHLSHRADRLPGENVDAPLQSQRES